MSYWRFVLLAFVLGALLVGITVDAATSSMVAQFALQNTRVFGLVSVTSLVAIVGAVGSFAYLIRSRRSLVFTDEIMQELAKVTWPNREETLRASTTVVVTTLLVAGLLGVYDFFWKNLADLILFTES